MVEKVKSQRQLQLGENIKRIIADIFSRSSLSSIKNSYITVVQADVSPDIKNCKIFINIYGKNNDDNQQIVNKLNQMSPSISHELGKKLTTRNTPKITFHLDETSQKAFDIESLIKEESYLFSESNANKKTKKNINKNTLKKK